jgi:hypothetical protein
MLTPISNVRLVSSSENRARIMRILDIIGNHETGIAR